MNLSSIFRILDATRRQKEQITQWAAKAGKDADKIISWVEENFKSDNEQVVAARWICQGYDPKFFKQALYICNQKKMDPMKQNPSELVQSNPDIKPKEKPIDPSTVLTDEQKDDNGNVTYAARDEDREVLRQILNTHYGVDSSPWCLLQGDGKGNLSKESERYWERYSAYPKRVAFRNGKLLAFSAGQNPKVREWWDRFDRSFPFIPFDGKEWVGRDGATYSIKKGEVFKTSEEARERLNTQYSTDIESNSSEIAVHGNKIYFRGHDKEITREDDKYYYIDEDDFKCKVDKDMLTFEGKYETFSNGRPKDVVTYVHGKKEGPAYHYERGGGHAITNYKNNEKDGAYAAYRDAEEKDPRETGYYKNGEKEGEWKYWDYQGNLMDVTNYKNGNKDGLCIEYDRGKVKSKVNYKDDIKDGVCEWYYDNGQLQTRATYKDDDRDGPFEQYYSNGQLETKGTYSIGGYVGDYVEYHENGQIHIKCKYNDNGDRIGKFVIYFDNGQIGSVRNYNSEGKRDGLCVEYFEDGTPELECTYKNDEVDGELKAWCETDHSKLRKHQLWKDGRMVKDYLNG